MSDDTPYGYYDFSEDDDYAAPEASCVDPVDVLREHWGYDDFRPLQRDIIDSVLNGKDTLGLMPTGGGKSITFQVPALMMPGLTLVVTPLVSLMKDQVDALRRRDIKGACLYNGMTRTQTEYTLERCRQRRLKLLYIAPERLGSDTFMRQLSAWDVSMIVVDEAHCISQWGHDFRPAYMKIRDLREYIPDAPVLALTASATPDVVQDIVVQLGMRSPEIFTMSFARDNISFLVRNTDAKFDKLVQILMARPGTGIVYVRSRKRTVELSEALCAAGISAQAYHAGLLPEIKSERQDAWISGATRIIVATTAFGMGIDKPDVRTVVHYDLPTTLEEYYQEAGRAGRDGLESVAVLLVNSRDRAVLGRRLTNAFPSRENIRHVYDEVCRYLSVPMGEGFGAIFDFDPEMMSSRYNMQASMVRTALGFLDRAGYISFTEDVDASARVWIRVTREDLYHSDFGEDDETVIMCLLRTYPGLFADYVFIDENRMAYATGIDSKRIYESLIRMRRRHILDYIPRRHTPYVVFTANRCPSERIVLTRDVYENRREVMKRQIDSMLDYAFCSDRCRVGGMLRYFGQNLPDTYQCGKCDYCRSQRKSVSDSIPIEEQVLALLETRDITISDIPRLWPSRSAEAADAIRDLISRHRLHLTGITITKS
ncbi:MAG: RecQ family ATP-dependent DNA helicase [Muribaculaceae bacterium]|nr:RecQ family ATP-dependent DNA helicase [Muribaculaceae bacterium]